MLEAHKIVNQTEKLKEKNFNENKKKNETNEKNNKSKELFLLKINNKLTSL